VTGHRRLWTLGVASAAWVALAACGDSGPSRADVVGAMTVEAVPARYAEAAVLAEAVAPAVEDWCAGGEADVVNEAVAEARAAWVELRPFSFGPANDRRSMFVIDPQIRAVDVDELGEDGAPVDADSLRELAGADQRGWQAVEHLATGDATDRRCEYARGAAELSADELSALADDWTEYGPGLADAESADVALRNIVSESLFAAQMAVDEPDPVLDVHRLDGIRWALVGDGTPEHVGLTPLLSDDLVERLTAELDARDATEVQLTISTEVVGELGTTVNFSDADGDG
jgi:predicted lipoprotein